eukprot:c11536_g1_i1.p1 GENE.c11536_g1_i1~~c11536_g1_i1.p1  ORF type:complete len:234 (-),score=41.62 c11536_g1_i1:49-750(-)
MSDLLSAVSAFSKKTDARDRFLRAVQFATKIQKWASPENQKLMATVSASLADSRKALKLFAFIESVDTIRTLSAKHPLLYFLNLGKNVFLALFNALDNSLWFAARGIIKPNDLNALKKLTFSAWLVAIILSIWSSLLSLRLLGADMEQKERQRKLKVQERKEGKNVDSEMTLIFEQINSLRQRHGTLIKVLIKDVLDFPVAVDGVRGGVGNPNTIGFFGLCSSLVGLNLTWSG